MELIDKANLVVRIEKLQSEIAEEKKLHEDNSMWYNGINHGFNLTKDILDTIEVSNNAFIEKACDFFEENIEEEDCKIGSSEWTELRAEYKSLDSFIRAFVEYMKGE